MSFVINRNEETWDFLGTSNYPTTGGWFDNSTSNQARGPVMYYDRLDVVFWDWALATTFPGGDSEEVCRLDPLFLDNAGTLFDAVAEPGTIDSLDCSELALGEWDRVANEQKIYAFSPIGSGAGKPFHEVSPLALNNVLQQDVWPNVGTHSARNGLIIGDPFFYNTGNGYWRFFETYGKGYLCNCNAWDSTGTQMQRVMAEVDLVTGNATIVPTPVYYGNAVSNEFTEAPLRGQNVWFQQFQFLSDDDGTPDRPKGLMYMWSDWSNKPGDSTRFRGWMKIIDWNPTSFSGIPNRIHLRERLLTAVDVLKATPGSLDGVHETGSNIFFDWVYHPRSNLLFFASNTANGVQLAANQQKLLFASPIPALDTITEPSAVGKISSGKSVAFGVEALGDLQEPITGVDVQFSLTGESTVDEVLATTPTPGETVTLANAVEPTDAVISPITVKEDGVVLTETTHYTLNRGASQITFIAPKPLAGGEVYTATYRHWDTTGVGPNGTLLNTFATSDDDGVAIARVRYAEEDPVPDRWDRLTAEDI